MFRFLSVVLVILICASCFKSQDTGCPYPNSNAVAPQAEQDSVKAYLDSNHISATLHTSGFYYNIVSPGSGTDTIRLCSQILVNYRGNVKDSLRPFDQASNAYFVLGSLIEGWKKGLPMIKRGGEIKLYVPPSLAYGANELKNDSGRVVIPAKSILIFDVKLLDYN